MHTKIGIVMGSRSQWSTIQHTAKILAQLGIAYEARIITANKNTSRLHEYACNAANRGLEIIIAGSARAAYLPEVLTSKTEIPVLCVPITTTTKHKKPSDSETYHNIGNQVGMLDAGLGGAVNAALFAAKILANKYPDIRDNLISYRNQNECDQTLSEGANASLNN